MIELEHGYLTIAEISGDPAQLAAFHRRAAPAMDAVGREHGLVVHVAAATDTGLVMVNLWPSRDGSEAAAGDPRRAAQLAAAGLRPEDFTRRHFAATRAVVFDG